MTKNEETTDKPVEAPAAEAAESAPKARKIVRRSASTRDNPAFTAEEAAAAAAAPVAEGAAPAEAKSPEAAAAPVPRPRATYDARAPRPAPGTARPTRSGDYRPPPGRPMGARPIPGGSRAPSGGGDYRPPPGRPMGARPIPGGPRAPMSDERRPHREGPPPGGGESRPRPGPGAGHEGGGVAPARPVAAARPVVPQTRPAPKPAGGIRTVVPVVAPSKKPGPKPVVHGPAPIPLNVPLPKANAASNKPALTAKEALSLRAKTAGGAKAKPARVEGAASEAKAAFDPALASIGPEGAKAALLAAGEGAAALVEAWLGASNAAAIAEVVEADDVAGPARKAARRALNVLRSRGVAVPERAHVVRMDDRAEVSIEATLLPPDSSGTCSISVTSKDASGRYHIAEVIVREPLGIVQAASGWLSGTQIKEGRARALEGLGVAPVLVPVEWARHRVAEARRLNAASGQIVPLGFDGCRELMEPTSAASPAHPLADLDVAQSAARAAAATAGSGALHQEPEFRTWLPDRGALDEMLQKLGEKLGADGMRDSDRVNVALREEMEAATDRFFSPEVRTIVVRRMRDAAISVRSRKGDRAAEEALAVAHAVQEAGLITAPPREIPFLVGFFQKALGVLAQQGGGQLRVPVAQGSQGTQEPAAEAPAAEAAPAEAAPAEAAPAE